MSISGICIKFGNIPNNTHVHHIDGNPKNNSPSNLELIDGKKHLKFHSSCGNNGNAKEATNEEIRIASLAIIKGLKDKTSAVLWTTYAEGGSVSSAAKAAGVSKGQAHKLLRRLEHEHGIPILRRTCKGDNERLTDTYIHKKGHARTIKTRQP